jgi:hypothetical protein
MSLAIAGAAAWWWPQTTGQTFNFDFAQAWGPDHAAIYGGPGYGQLWSAYPLPLILLFLPVGLLPASAAPLAGALLTAVLLAAALIVVEAFDRTTYSEAVRPKIGRFLPALISLPVLASVQDTHAFSALGLLGLVASVGARQRGRILMFGMTAAIASIRPINALPVVLCCLIGLSARDLARAAAGAASVGLPLTAVAFVIDRNWPTQYMAALNEYSSAGIYRELHDVGGIPLVAGFLIAIGAATGIAFARGRRLADMAALGMAATVLLTPTNGLYTGVFALPALMRIGMRHGTEWFPWAASGSAWAATLVVAPWLFSSTAGVAFSVLSAIAYWFVLNAYPLLWRGARLKRTPISGEA